MKIELIEAIREGTLMDFISSNYHRFTKEELKIIIVELDFTRGYMVASDNEKLIEELEERL